jgi:hypothetical protein
MARGYSRALVIFCLARGRSITHDNVAFLCHFVFCDPDRTCSPDMGPTIQEVRVSFRSQQVTAKHEFFL